MDKNGFPVQDSTLSAEALGTMVTTAYEIAKGAKCQFFRKGICDTYRIDDGNNRYFLKVYRSKRRTRRDVSEEVRLLLHLRADEISVVEPIARSDGQYINEIVAPEGTRFAVLFRGAPNDRTD